MLLAKPTSVKSSRIHTLDKEKRPSFSLMTSNWNVFQFSLITSNWNVFQFHLILFPSITKCAQRTTTNITTPMTWSLTDVIYISVSQKLLQIS